MSYFVTTTLSSDVLKRHINIKKFICDNDVSFTKISDNLNEFNSLKVKYYSLSNRQAMIYKRLKYLKKLKLGGKYASINKVKQLNNLIMKLMHLYGANNIEINTLYNYINSFTVFTYRYDFKSNELLKKFNSLIASI